jgi:hypothetical protein
MPDTLHRSASPLPEPAGERPFRIGRSRAGLGLFATQRIPKGVRIFEYTGRIVTNEEADRTLSRSRYCYDLNSRFTLDGSPRSNVGRYANHSCRPNGEAYVWRGRVFVRSLRAIEPGEEITYDYGRTYFDAFIGKDRCLCEACVERRGRAARKARAKAGPRRARR